MEKSPPQSIYKSEQVHIGSDFQHGAERGCGALAEEHLNHEATRERDIHALRRAAPPPRPTPTSFVYGCNPSITEAATPAPLHADFSATAPLATNRRYALALCSSAAC